MARMRKCHLCGKEYKYCNTCEEDKYAPVWKSTFHSENCAKIFKCAVDFGVSLITKEEAKSILLECDLTDKESFREDVQNAISEIMKEQDPEPEDKKEKDNIPFIKREKHYMK